MNEISHERAMEAAHRLIQGAFRRDGLVLPIGDRPRFSIPCRPDHDDDCVIREYIKQQKKKEANYD